MFQDGAFTRYEDLAAAEKTAGKVTNVSSEFEFVLDHIWLQAFLMFACAFVNFLSHFVMPWILMYHRQIKLVNSVNLCVVGLMCLIVLIMYRFNDAANFCTGQYLTEEEIAKQLSMDNREYLIERGNFLRVYTTLVITISCIFMIFVALLCFLNLKKMGF